MDTESTGPALGPTPGWQARRGGTRVYFCCCPLMLVVTPFLLLGRLIQYGVFRFLGRPVTAWWQRPAGPAPAPSDRAEEGVGAVTGETVTP